MEKFIYLFLEFYEVGFSGKIAFIYELGNEIKKKENIIIMFVHSCYSVSPKSSSRRAEMASLLSKKHISSG